MSQKITSLVPFDQQALQTYQVYLDGRISVDEVLDKIGFDALLCLDVEQTSREYLERLNPPDDWMDKNYQAVIRRFKNGGVEVCARLVRPMSRMAQAEAWQNHFPIHPTRKTIEDEKLPVDGEEKRQENLDRAIRRAKQQVRFHVKGIGADHLLTLTYRTINDQPMDDIEKLKTDWQRFVRLVRNGLPACGELRRHHGLKTWQFVAVREKQDNGAFHLHVAVVGRQDINFIRRCWYVAIGGNQDDEGENTKGQINVRGPSKRFGVHTAEWKASKLSGYMTKYLHKAFAELGASGSKRYWASKYNDKVELEKIWLAASSWEDAVRETMAHARVMTGCGYLSLWASWGLDVCWVAASANSTGKLSPARMPLCLDEMLVNRFSV